MEIIVDCFSEYFLWIDTVVLSDIPYAVLISLKGTVSYSRFEDIEVVDEEYLDFVADDESAF